MSENLPEIKVGETDTYLFDFSNALVYRRQSQYQYSVGEFITDGNHVYECTNAGITAKKKPTFGTQIDGPAFDDGTVQWTCRDYSMSGSDTIQSAQVTAESGITVDSFAVEKSVYVRVTITATAKGCHKITCSMTSAAGVVYLETREFLVTD